MLLLIRLLVITINIKKVDADLYRSLPWLTTAMLMNNQRASTLENIVHP